MCLAVVTTCGGVLSLFFEAACMSLSQIALRGHFERLAKEPQSLKMKFPILGDTT